MLPSQHCIEGRTKERRQGAPRGPYKSKREVVRKPLIRGPYKKKPKAVHNRNNNNGDDNVSPQYLGEPSELDDAVKSPLTLIVNDTVDFLHINAAADDDAAAGINGESEYDDAADAIADIPIVYDLAAYPVQIAYDVAADISPVFHG